MTDDALTDLIPKLEAAKEPSRALDLQISVAVDFKGAFKPYREGEFYRWGAGGDEIEFCNIDGDRIGCLDPAQFVPRWTASLDAALSLVPERHRWLLDRRPFAEQREDGYRAQVYKQGFPYASDMHDMPTAWAATPALALCIASLKARAAT